MPWRVKKQFILFLLGCGAIVLGGIVLGLNYSEAKTDMLAAVAILGGVAIIINSLPDNGHGNGKPQDGL